MEPLIGSYRNSYKPPSPEPLTGQTADYRWPMADVDMGLCLAIEGSLSVLDILVPRFGCPQE